VLVLQLDAEHRAGEDGLNPAFDFDVFFFGWRSHADGPIKIKKGGIRFTRTPPW
jgi:hypothetical protein